MDIGVSNKPGSAEEDIELSRISDIDQLIRSHVILESQK